MAKKQLAVVLHPSLSEEAFIPGDSQWSFWSLLSHCSMGSQTARPAKLRLRPLGVSSVSQCTNLKCYVCSNRPTRVPEIENIPYLQRRFSRVGKARWMVEWQLARAGRQRRKVPRIWGAFNWVLKGCWDLSRRKASKKQDKTWRQKWAHNSYRTPFSFGLIGYISKDKAKIIWKNFSSSP